MKVFLSGIAGTGMSSLAGLFREKGYEVYGSDIYFYPPVDKILEKMNIRIFTGFDPKNIPGDVDLCIIGNVISRGNPETEFILNQGIPFLSMASALYEFFIRGKKSIVVSGTHGKTTIASFISYLLSCAGLGPGFFIGGKPLNFDGNFTLGSGDYFVTEGDEYETAFFDRSSKFLKYFPRYLIISALEYDHIDFFPDPSLYLKSFQNLVNQVPSDGLIIANGDFEMNRMAIGKAFTPVISYGYRDCDCGIEGIEPENGGYRFSLKRKSARLDFQSSILGRHNIWNLAAGIILGMHLDIPEGIIKEAVENFRGVERRMNIIKTIHNTIFVEDFAHHPTAIESLLKSLRENYPGKKICALFEPRNWSLRKNYFQDALMESLMNADLLWIKDVYEKEKIHPDERLNVAAIQRGLENAGKPVLVFAGYEEIKDFLKTVDCSQHQVVAIISNGDFGGIPVFVKNLAGS